MGFNCSKRDMRYERDLLWERDIYHLWYGGKIVSGIDSEALV